MGKVEGATRPTPYFRKDAEKYPMSIKIGGRGPVGNGPKIIQKKDLLRYGC